LSEYQYLVDRYSQNLTKYDVLELFERLKEAKGNIAAATKEVEIQRKTVYDWENSGEDIKTSTKRKILEASLSADFHGTVEFLIRKNAMNYHELLERYISVYCDEIDKINEPKELETRVTHFEDFVKSHIGAIHDIKTIPIEEMVGSINQKSSSLGAKEIAKDINLLSPQRLFQRFILLLEAFDKKTLFKSEMANKLHLPEKFIDQACKAISYIDPPKEVREELTQFARKTTPHMQEVGFEHNTQGYIHARKE
jgi:ACT domain-containing protein